MRGSFDALLFTLEDQLLLLQLSLARSNLPVRRSFSTHSFVLFLCIILLLFREAYEERRQLARLPNSICYTGIPCKKEG